MLNNFFLPLTIHACGCTLDCVALQMSVQLSLTTAADATPQVPARVRFRNSATGADWSRTRGFKVQMKERKKTQDGILCPVTGYVPPGRTAHSAGPLPDVTNNWIPHGMDGGEGASKPPSPKTIWTSGSQIDNQPPILTPLGKCAAGSASVSYPSFLSSLCLPALFLGI